MQDARLRLLATITLSGAAVSGIPGAGLTFLWWLACTPRWDKVPRRGILVAFLFIVITAVVLQISGGPGISYLVRFSVILLIAAWAYTAFRPGELMDVGVWLFGDGIGFDLGLVGEMSLQSLQVSADDLSRIMTAQRMKGIGWNWRTFAPALATLVHLSLRRADDQAGILAIRGYRKGGTHIPVFPKGKWDRVTTVCALAILCISLLSVQVVVL
ncbi:MAG: energy-coupling factor transporter transmembrane protein EcfT [Methanomicrobiales archaeon]|nr:energy-coupling factor transporter transmembrane protein EcfT [Methanomicrobiales archaeon]